MSTPELTAKTVLITGAGRGFGELLARRCHALGASVVLIDRNAADVERLALALGDRALACAADVTDLAALEAARQQALARFGQIDVVVANAGITAMGSVEHIDLEAFRRVLEVNLFGVLHTLRAMTDPLRAQRGYALVVASMASAIHSPLNSAYVASKAAVEGLADCYRQEVADDGVGVGIIYPTFAATDMMKFTLQDELGKRIWGGNKGLFAMVSPEQVVDAMLGAIARRSKRVVVPSHLASVAAAPWLFHGFIEQAMRRAGAGDALRTAKAAAGKAART
jgi:NAD(P)-dependent dehydrogenase (short-subunit alcohol dehydrogenase family)